MGFHVGRPLRRKPRLEAYPTGCGNTETSPLPRRYAIWHIKNAEWRGLPGSDSDAGCWRLKTLGLGNRTTRMDMISAILFLYSMYDRQEMPRRMNDNPKQNTLFSSPLTDPVRSDNLLKSTVDGRPDSGVLPEVDRRHRALGNALRSELELLQRLLANPSGDSDGIRG